MRFTKMKAVLSKSLLEEETVIVEFDESSPWGQYVSTFNKKYTSGLGESQP